MRTANGNNGNGKHAITEQAAMDFLCDRVSFSSFLSWLDVDDHGEYNLYETTEGVGIAYEVFLPSFIGEEYERSFKQLFSISYPEDTIITFFCYPSSNIKPYIDMYRAAHTYTPNVDNPEILQEIIKKRGDFYENAADDGFWPGIKFRPRYFKNLITFLIPYSAFKGDMHETYDVAQSLAPRIKGLLTGLGLNPAKFDASSFRSLMKEILNVGFKGVVDFDKNRDMRHQIIDTNTNIRIEQSKDGNSDIRIKQNGRKKFIRVYSVTNYPRKMDLWTFNNQIFKWNSKEISPALSSPFGFSLSVKYTDWKKTKFKLQTKAAWNIKQTKKNPLMEYIPKIAKRAEESQYVQEIIEDGGIPLPSYFSLFFIEDTQARLDYLSYEVLNKLTVSGFEFQREVDKGMVSLFLDMLPLNHISQRDDFLNKRSTLFDANIASMVPFVAGVYGSGSPVLMYVDRKGQLCFWDRFVSDTNYNVTKVAESGGGKSVSQVDAHAHSLTVGRRVRVVDIGRSYEPFCKDIGGEYIEITEKRRPCFNFFTNILSKCPSCGKAIIITKGRCTECNGEITEKDFNIHEDEMDSIVPLVGFLCGLNISKQVAEQGEDNTAARYASIIIEAINSAYKKKQRKAGLEDVATAFLEINDIVGDKLPQKLYQAIQPYSLGAYRSYFNGECNIHYSKDYVVLELEEVATKDSRLQVAIIFSLLIKVMREVFIDWSKLGRRSEVDVDEAWLLFMLVMASEFMNSAARRFRKYESSLCVITQGIDDAHANPTTKAIWDNSAHKVYLKMSQSAIEKAAEEKKIVMDEFSKEWFKTLTTHRGKFSEIYFRSPGVEGVVRLVLDRYSYGLSTTTGEEKNKLRDLAKQYGTNIGGLLKILTEKEPVGDILVRLGISPLARDLALTYQTEHARDRKLGEILKEMGAITDEMLQEALKIQEEQLSWEKVFSTN